MSKLIEELKAEHAEIVDILLRVKLLNIGFKDGQQMLMAAKNRLLEHLRKEDAELYPALNRAAKDDQQLRQSLDYSVKDVEEVTRNVLQFYAKYSEETPADASKNKFTFFTKKTSNKIQEEFLRDFDRLYLVLLERLGKEEEIFFPAFEKVDQPQRTVSL